MSEAEAKKVVGSVLVVGGGISGMQSALDLAESGLKVYLAEEKSAIGGTMARLDKTFPTNDCSMCIVSPKLVDVGRHLNIDIITGAKVKSVDGEQGSFKVRLNKKARYIDLKKCTSCGECARACPVELPSEFNGGLDKRNAVYKLYAQATPSAYAIEKKGTPPCRVACPAGVNVQGYVQLIKAGKILEAWQLIYNNNPFPAVCGRVCTHPCEAKCHRGKIDAPVSIKNLKRFVAEKIYELDIDALPLPKREEYKGKSVAIIGSGPAGLSAAYHLVKHGYSAVVFEAGETAGGMMRKGIPEYRLPKKYLDLEVRLLEKIGVEIRYNQQWGTDFSMEKLKSEFDAVFIATGTFKPYQLGVPGEDLDRVIPGINFLNSVNIKKDISLSGRVTVIGGGNVAIDTARSAIRVGAKEVHIFSLEKAGELPALDEEIHLAAGEGIIFHHSRAVKRILGKGSVKSIELVGVASVFDENGSFNPQYDNNIIETFNTDYLLVAIGQGTDYSFLAGNDKALLNDAGRLQVDIETLETNLPGIFAGGDSVTGPRDVISAVSAGKTVAESIHRYLNETEQRENRVFQVPDEKIAPLRQKIDEVPQSYPSTLTFTPADQGLQGFVQENTGLTPEQATAEAERCLNCGVCSECGECVKACLPKAINHTMSDEELEIEVGAILLNPGSDIYDPTELEYLGYKKYPNVLTSIEFERILSASGPYQGHLVRPSDGKEPQKIAWIQCVGSRNKRINHDYCSSVCCMYAMKEAVIAKEHSANDLETTIFLMDMRSYGKDFERYYNRAREEHGVRFIKSRIYEVNAKQDDSDNLTIRYANEDGSISHEEFDMVILSVGFKPSCGSAELAGVLGVKLDNFGFCKTGELLRGLTSRPGIFASGVFTGPKDIPETVMEASAVAGYASRLLAPARGTLTQTKEYPPEKPVGKGAPRIGAFICNCGINIGSVVKVPEVVAYAKTLKNVVYAQEFLFTCSQDSIEKIKQVIEEHNLTRVIVASCTPRTHAPLFQSALQEAGLNPYLYEHVNIREHSSWVHREKPREATEKAKVLLRMAAAKAALLKPIAPSYTSVNHTALVVGGGAAGMTSALSLAEQGFMVYLVEKNQELGGQLRNIYFTFEDKDPQQELHQLIEKINHNPNIKVMTGSEIDNFTGYPGNYKTTIKTGDKVQELSHGAVILATGAREVETNEYQYGNHPQVITQTELEKKLALGGGKEGSSKEINNIVMIQCVGSRNEKSPYCSRICCSQAIKNALKLKENNPDAQIFILYRDIRSYGLMEKYYTKARSKGVIFIRYNESEKPQVTNEDNKLQVLVKDHVLGQYITINPDYLVLSTGIAPNQDNFRLSQFFKVPLDADGFFLEAHMKLRPVDFAADGLYLCGLAHAPKLAGESILQANAAAMRAATLLSKEKLENVAITASVNPKRCVGCGMCVKACSYNAREIDSVTRVANVTEVLCQGCGACVVACPNGATQQKGFEKAQMLAALQAAVDGEVS